MVIVHRPQRFADESRRGRTVAVKNPCPATRLRHDESNCFADRINSQDGKPGSGQSVDAERWREK